MNCEYLSQMRISLSGNSMTPPQPSQQTPKDAEKAEPLTVSSDTLLAGRRELIIEHDNQRYRLLLTRSNKLILTK